MCPIGGPYGGPLARLVQALPTHRAQINEEYLEITIGNRRGCEAGLPCGGR